MSETFCHGPLVVIPSLLPAEMAFTFPDSAKQGIDEGAVLEWAAKHPKGNDINAFSDNELKIEGNEE